ncbi:MICOS complex subunit mic19 [Ceratocystis fimbriata CBS 114723]|uniref:MICOS complex subunit mic19 n=1 Tax=Ceratocystis fimbriata CBS 114723 TaxID=1035309 RepID=A0A2C5XA54_9PEZI|nr:MICOS complex subunit mic19 [Ceratocystis fimbriata CBS 114723]
MGASSSKTSQEWKASGPTGVSHDLIESLQSSKETDLSRAKLLETHIEARVAAELAKLHNDENARLAAVQERLGAAPAETDESLTSHVVSKEIENLRVKLEARKNLRELPPSVEAARGSVVRCLREHDRRPLDCWKEVQAFKDEVKALEKSWVDKVTA